jgi:Ni,Fe-hydrogenase maturation factor
MGESMAKPIFCDRNGLWKEELKKRLKTNEHVTLLALGQVKQDVIAYLNSRTDLNIISIDTRYMKEKSKGLGLKVKVIKKLQ